MFWFAVQTKNHTTPSHCLKSSIVSFCNADHQQSTDEFLNWSCTGPGIHGTMAGAVPPGKAPVGLGSWSLPSRLHPGCWRVWGCSHLHLHNETAGPQALFPAVYTPPPLPQHWSHRGHCTSLSAQKQGTQILVLILALKALYWMGDLCSLYFIFLY